MRPIDGENGPRAKLEKIELDLSAFNIQLHFLDHKDPLVIHFGTPSRRFYFALIALVVNEMKKLSEPGFVHIRKHEKTLIRLDQALADPYASKTAHGMWEKIRKAWHYRLPDLEQAAHFKILERDLIPPSEKGGKYRYDCSDDECDIWATLLGVDEKNKWRFKFAVDSAFLSLNDIQLTLGDLRDCSAWQAFLKNLISAKKLEPAPDIAQEAGERQKSKGWQKLAITAVAILIIFATGVAIRNLYFAPISPPAQISLPDRPSIVVLPFVNMSGDPDKAYFSDGITEELTNTLAKLEGLRVISRTSAFYLKEKALDISTIGEKLKVDTVLEGSVRIEGDNLRITAQLIKVADDSHLWAGTYDREIKNFCAIQEEVSRAIVHNLKPRILDRGDRRPFQDCIENVEAYDLYFRGLFFNKKRTAVGYHKAIEYYQRSLKLVPNHAPAYAGLAIAYCGLTHYSPPMAFYPKAKAAALKAIELDDTLAETFTALAFINLFIEWDWLGLERTSRRAIELDPDNAMAHRYYSSWLTLMGRPEEGVSEIKKAQELDPFSVVINHCVGGQLRYLRKYDLAIEEFEKTLEMFPNFHLSLAMLGMTYAHKGEFGEALAILEKGKTLYPRNHLILSHLGYVYAASGNKTEARKLLDEVFEQRKQRYFSAMGIAVIYSGLGERYRAFKWLETAYDERDSNMFRMKTSPEFDNLQSDPRWTTLLKKMGLET